MSSALRNRVAAGIMRQQQAASNYDALQRYMSDTDLLREEGVPGYVEGQIIPPPGRREHDVRGMMLDAPQGVFNDEWLAPALDYHLKADMDT